MYNNMRVLAIIPARAGSKGIPGKNIKPLNGTPLIGWTCLAAKQSRYIDRLIVSTDDGSIGTVAQQYGCDLPFLRPENLATDTSSSVDLVVHALDNLPERYDAFVLLQPTSPFRAAADIDACIEKLADSEPGMVATVMEVKKHPAHFYRPDGDTLTPAYPGDAAKRRQDMPHLYEHTGAVYAARVADFRQRPAFNQRPFTPYFTSGLRTLDIDTPDDWTIAELIAEQFVP